MARTKMEGVKKTRHSQLLRSLFWATLWLVLAAAVWTRAVIYSQNILYFNPHWSPHSLTLHALRTGGIITLFNRRNLASDRLSSRQNTLRVLSRRSYDVREIEFDFRPQANSYVAFLFNVTDNDTENLSFSTDPLKPSLHYLSDAHERYPWSRPTGLALTSYQRVHARLVQEEARIAIYLDGKRVTTVAGSFRNTRVGFEISPAADVWDPTIVQKDGTRVTLPFQRGEDFFSFYWKNLALLAVVTALLVLPFHKRRLLLSPRFTAFLLAMGVTWFAYDYLWYSKILQRWHHGQLVLMRKENGGSVELDYEKLRYRFMETWYRVLGGTTPTRQALAAENILLNEERSFRFCTTTCISISADLSALSPRPTKGLRILVMGGSMSFGWGTSDISQVYVEKLHHGLRQHYGENVAIETLNTSSADLEFNRDLQKKIFVIKKFQPDVLILSVLLRPALKPSFDRIFREVDASRTTTIYLRPPTDLESLDPIYLPLLRNYVRPDTTHSPPPGVAGFQHDALLRGLLKTHGWHFLDANHIFLDPTLNARGKKFWDYMHPTDWGHELLASYLLNELIQLRQDSGVSRP